MKDFHFKKDIVTDHPTIDPNLHPMVLLRAFLLQDSWSQHSLMMPLTLYS